MKILIIAPGCSKEKGRNDLALFRWIQMVQGRIEVWFLATHLAKDPGNVRHFFYKNFTDSWLSKIKKIWNYYKTDYANPDLPEKPDIIQIHSPYLWALGKHFPDIPKIFFAHDVNWQLLEFNMAHSPSLKKLPFKKLWHPWFLWRAREYEKKALKEASHTFVYSERDKEEILKTIPELEDKITVIPNSLDPAEYQPTHSSGETILFMGPLDYIANLDAADTICQELAPRLPDLSFKILGGGTYTKKVPKNVEFLGFVSDVKTYLKRTRVFIVPLRYGSGTRFKILEALAMQHPVVSTPKGAEGLEVTHGKNIWIEKDWGKFAKAIERLWHHPEEAQRLGIAGRQFVEEKHGYESNSSLALDVYASLLK